MLRKAIVAAALVTSTAAQADSTTTCTRSALGTFVNCTTSEDKPNAAAVGLGSLIGTLIFKGKRKKEESDVQASAPAYAPPKSYDIDLSGNIFLDVCGGNFRDGRDTLGLGICVGYVAGIMHRDNAFPEGRRSCVPEGVLGDQALAMTVNAVRSQPAYWHWPTDVLVSATMTAAFPCTPATPP